MRQLVHVHPHAAHSWNTIAGVLEKLRVRTIGVKDVLTEELAGKPLPLALFLDEGLRTKG